MEPKKRRRWVLSLPHELNYQKESQPLLINSIISPYHYCTPIKTLYNAEKFLYNTRKVIGKLRNRTDFAHTRAVSEAPMLQLRGSTLPPVKSVYFPAAIPNKVQRRREKKAVTVNTSLLVSEGKKWVRNTSEHWLKNKPLLTRNEVLNSKNTEPSFIGQVFHRKISNEAAKRSASSKYFFRSTKKANLAWLKERKLPRTHAICSTSLVISPPSESPKRIKQTLNLHLPQALSPF